MLGSLKRPNTASETWKSSTMSLQVISTKLDTPTLFHTIVSQIAEQLNCTHCTLFLPQENEGELFLTPQGPIGERPAKS